MTLHFLNDVDTSTIDNYVKIASLNSEMINKIPGWRLLISILPGWALKMHVESLGKSRNVNKSSQSLAW